MEFIKDYAVSIITVSILAIILENILPNDGNKKFIHVIIGLVVMLVILNPLTKLPHFAQTLAIPYVQLDDSALTESSQKSFLAETFERNLANSITEDVFKTYKMTVNCKITCSLNENGEISGIRQVQLIPYSQEIAHYIAEKYGIEEVCIGP